MKKLCFVLLFFTSGCAIFTPVESKMYVPPGEYQLTDPKNIQIYRNRPKQNYIVLGEVYTEFSVDSYKKEIRNQAASMGADAVYCWEQDDCRSDITDLFLDEKHCKKSSLCHAIRFETTENEDNEDEASYDEDETSYDEDELVDAEPRDEHKHRKAKAKHRTSSLNVPRVMFWWGKVNQHWNIERGLWETDPDGSSGAREVKINPAEIWPHPSCVAS